MHDREGVLGALEGKSPGLFLVAGGVMIVFAVNTSLKTFAGTSAPVVQNIVAPFGFLVGVLGLLGLSPTLGDRSPRLAKVATSVALVTTVGWVLIVGVGLGKAAGMLSEPSGPVAMLPFVVIISMILGYGLFGLASLRTGAHSRLVGGLLLLESAMFLVLVLRVAPYLLLIDIGHIIAHLGLGAALRATGIPSESTEVAADSTV